jgi:hypothetical protein
MLGPKGLAGPTRLGVQLHSDKIADLPVFAIADLPFELVLGRTPVNQCADRDGGLGLQAHAGTGDVFQERRRPVVFPVLIFPADPYQVRA